MDQQSTEDVPRLSAAGAERWTISHGSVGLSVHICPSLLQRSALPEHHCTLSSPKLTLRGLNHMIRFTALITLHIPAQRVYWESELTACWPAYKLRTYALFNWWLTLSQSSLFVHGFRPYSKLKLSCPIKSSLGGGGRFFTTDCLSQQKRSFGTAMRKEEVIIGNNNQRAFSECPTLLLCHHEVFLLLHL